MANEATSSGQATETREQSTIAFPYHDLDGSIEVARAVYNRSGLGSCDLDELAAEMGQVISGNFRVKVGAARTFGLVEKDGRAAVKLSDLGRAVIADDDPASAKVDAFMAVPLYSKLYEAYNGQKLPPMKALEREMASLGVAVKQADKARQAFERSARQAGFFNAGSDRLVRPRVDALRSQRPSGDTRGEEPKSDSSQKRDSGGDDRGVIVEPAKGEGGSQHPLIQGLLITLPSPGAEWASRERKAWLTMAESIFDMIYTDTKKATDE